jgi:hypothetical protein
MSEVPFHEEYMTIMAKIESDRRAIANQEGPGDGSPA